MTSPATVLVIGAGRFGRNYLEVIRSIATSPPAGLPRIGRLVLSRTGRPAAGEAARALAAPPDCPFDQVVGVAISDERQLQRVLVEHAPHLVCIVARDQRVGDDIHADYSRAALDAGAAVLCEKPFSRPDSDGQGADRARDLARHPGAGRFGLELPMAVVRDAMWADGRLHALFKAASDIEMLWELPGESYDLICDLAAHPWSLLPPHWRAEVRKSIIRDRSVDITMVLHDPADKMDRQCTIRLGSGGTFRGMRVDGHLFQFLFDQGQLQVWAHPERAGAIAQRRTDGRKISLVLSVDNPLRQHIEAALRARPLVDLQETIRCQDFLEAVVRIAGASKAQHR